ncbi:MAG: molecular chaperone HtpG [Verrucomicrobiota bacterium]|nr:molecular chaperone HtpG [Verrucomicrobiota bacterium]
MRQNQLSVHSENILPIIKKWLYSERDIFLRELVSNATDALTKVRLLEPEKGSFVIELLLDKEAKTLSIIDSGIGMTEEEVEKYIAQIAFSGAEEFAAKYQKGAEPIIGHFGLGFYSSYMVAKKVEIDTLSYLPGSTPVFWSCDGGASYTIGAGTRKERGTRITLHLNEESLDYLEEHKLRSLLDRYCKFMPFPISFQGKSIENREPLWLKSPAECTEKEYLECYRSLFPLEPDPLFWVHLNIDYPFHLKGILFFPKEKRRFDGEEGAIKLFCNKVFVSDNCKEILPDYLMVLRGAIDSSDLPLNVSRSYLQVDQSVKQLSTHIVKKVTDRLVQLLKTERESYIGNWPEIELFVKLGILQDPKFYERAKELLLWKSSDEIWTTVEDYLERAKEKKVFYSSREEKTPLFQVYKEKKLEILFAASGIDIALIQFLESKLSVPFQRIDGVCHEGLLDATREKTLLDESGRTQAAKIADFIRASLDQKELEIEAKSLASDTLPAILVVSEQERRLRDYLALTQGKEAQKNVQPKRSFIVNTNHTLVQAIERLSTKDPDLAGSLAKSLYHLSSMSQRETQGVEDFEEGIAQQTAILEKLVSRLCS